MFYKILVFKKGKKLGYFDGVNAGNELIIKNDSKRMHLIHEIMYYDIFKVLNKNNYNYQLIEVE